MNKTILKCKKFILNLKHKLIIFFTDKYTNNMIEDCKKRNNKLLIKINLEKQRADCLEKSLMQSTVAIEKLEDEYIEKIENIIKLKAKKE